MSLALARSTAPNTPLRLAAALAGPRRPKPHPVARDWLKVAHRLAAGLGPSPTGHPEGGEEPLVQRLLEREEFRALVEGVKARLAEPPESRKRRLVGLAQQALERALLLDDAGAALFVLEEDARERDPAVSLADGVLRAEARALTQAAPPAAPAAAGPEKPPGFGYALGYDPLRAMMHRGAARLRDAIRVEDAVRHATVAATEPTQSTPQLITAQRAWELKQAATTEPRPTSERPEPFAGEGKAGSRPQSAATTPPRGSADPRGPP